MRESLPYGLKYSQHNPNCLLRISKDPQERLFKNLHRQTTQRVFSCISWGLPTSLPLFSYFLNIPFLNFPAFPNSRVKVVSVHLSELIPFTAKISCASFFFFLFKEKLIGPNPKLTVVYLNVLLRINNILSKARVHGCPCKYKQDQGQNHSRQQTTTACQLSSFYKVESWKYLFFT